MNQNLRQPAFRQFFHTPVLPKEGILNQLVHQVMGQVVKKRLKENCKTWD